jgi:pimeloyl-ACP methyl ester carboxylesterase
VVLADVFPRLLGDTSERDRPEVVARVRDWVASATPEAVAWAQRAMAARPDSFATLRDCAVPGLVVVGDEDRITSVEAAQAMAEALPRGELAVLPGSGHLSPVETPEAFAFAVAGWLSGL